MPRSSVVLTPEPVDAAAIGRAAASVHDRVTGGDGAPFKLRPLDDGAVLQVVVDDVVVLSVLRPRLAPEDRERERVLPGVTAPEITRWWTEAYTPWHAGGALGVAILDALDGVAIHGGVGRED
ncbi:hypothetical protein FBY40_0846 [Microbacterium sp. SLBN-154]|uniref:hypothetical protein n=1 Tax=Microbacterium sp. SLBN-154 TaxID=2768458 RepID=UPI001150DCF9|nr:hypothetical protein [Microbacterium sp. SLBN-154]TQK18359.1 hypothetical protein FBY40_0846 [Microbacterium sp. SLBN-154]